MGKFKGSDKGKGGKAKVSAFARAAAKSEPSKDKGEEFDFPGKYHVRLTNIVESDNGSFGLTFVGCGEDEGIGERIQWFSVAGKSSKVSGPRLKRLAMLLAGTDDSYFDPHGEFLDAILRFDLDEAAEWLAENGHAKSAAKALAALESAEVMIKVSKGGEKDNGDHFRNAEFSPVKDAEDSDDEDEDEDEEAPESEDRPRKPSKKAPSRKRAEPEEDDEDDAEEDEDDSDDDSENEEDDEDPPSERKPSKKAKRRGK